MDKSNVIQLPCDDSLVDPFGEFVNKTPPLIKAGIYDMTAVKHTLGPNKFGSKGKLDGKLTIYFQIVEYGDAFEVILPRHYNVKLKKLKSGRYKFTFGNRSDFYYDYRKCFPWRQNERKDRTSIRPFYGNTIRGVVTTVIKDYKGRELFQEDRYSKVKRLICIKDL